MNRRATGIAVLWAAFSMIPALSHAEDLLAQADIAYGEYLAGECVTCHSADGADQVFHRLLDLMPKALPTSCMLTGVKSLIIKPCNSLLAGLMMSKLLLWPYISRCFNQNKVSLIQITYMHKFICVLIFFVII